MSLEPTRVAYPSSYVGHAFLFLPLTCFPKTLPYPWYNRPLGPELVEEANCQSHLRKPKGSKIMPRELCKKRCWPLEFAVEDHVYLKVSPMKGMKRFGIKWKLAPCYIGPFPILEKCGNVTYKLELPPSLVGVHDIFHVSQLKKCLKVPVDVVLPEVAPLEAELTYPEHPVKILDQKDRIAWRKTIKFFKIQWTNHTEEEATRESGDFLRSRHPDFALP
jgi:hypothetical protein